MISLLYKKLESSNQILNFVRSQGFRRYLINTFWLFLDKVVSMVIALFVGLYVARYLGPKDFGLFSFARSVAIFFTAFAALGLESVLIRNLINDPNRKEELIATAFYLRLIAGLLCTLVIVLIWMLVPSTLDYIPLIAVLVGTSCFNAFLVISQLYESRVESKLIVWITLAQTILTSLLKVYLVQINASVIWFAVAIALESVLTAIGLVLLYQTKDGSITRWKFNKKLSFDLLKDSWPLILSGFIILIYMKTDQIMIMYLLNETAVGHYAAAARLTEIWYFVGGVCTSSLFPAIVNARNSNQILYEARIQKLFDLMMILALAIALPVSLLSKDIVLLLYGDAFSAASNVLQIQVWSLIFIFLGLASSRWLLAENLQKKLIHLTFFGAIANVGLNFILIPRMGIYGAAIATLVAQVLSSYLGYALYGMTRQIFYMQTQSLFFFSGFRFLERLISKKSV